MENYNTSSISKFYDANEGYIKGNLCKETYKPYKNYVPKETKTKNDQEHVNYLIRTLPPHGVYHLPRRLSRGPQSPAGDRPPREAVGCQSRQIPYSVST